MPNNVTPLAVLLRCSKIRNTVRSASDHLTVVLQAYAKYGTLLAVLLWCSKIRNTVRSASEHLTVVLQTRHF